MLMWIARNALTIEIVVVPLLGVAFFALISLAARRTYGAPTVHVPAYVGPSGAPAGSAAVGRQIRTHHAGRRHVHAVGGVR